LRDKINVPRRNVPSTCHDSRPGSGHVRFHTFLVTSPDTNGQPCSMAPRYASMTYHHSVTHFPFRFWYVYDDGRNSRSHHKGLYFSSSVTFCTASYLSSVTLSPPGSSGLAGTLCPSGWDESLFCLIVRRMCNCSNASNSNRMWHSARIIHIYLLSAYHARTPECYKTYQNDTQQTKPSSHLSRTAHPSDDDDVHHWANVTSA
jgi:hypothetical protein